MKMMSGLARAEGLKRIAAHLENCRTELLAAGQVEFADEVASDEFIVERMRLALAEIAELSRLVGWKRLAEEI
jgi:hypothetical protein